MRELTSLTLLASLTILTSLTLLASLTILRKRVLLRENIFLFCQNCDQQNYQNFDKKHDQSIDQNVDLEYLVLRIFYNQFCDGNWKQWREILTKMEKTKMAKEQKKEESERVIRGYSEVQTEVIWGGKGVFEVWGKKSNLYSTSTFNPLFPPQNTFISLFYTTTSTRKASSLTKGSDS